MTQPTACPQCGNTVLGGAAFCPSCGSALSPNLAGSFERFCAASVDIAIWLSLSALLIWLSWKWWLSLVIWVGLTELGYQLNGSLGKSLIGLSIPVKTRRQHYLRETIGKLASLAIFGIGYLMILSKEHQALHDYMAKTRVLRTGKLQGPRLAAITLCLLLSVVIGGYHFTHPKTASSPVPSNQSQNASLDPIIIRIPAVVTLYTYDTRGKAVAQGSGFLITSNGVAVTNFHVLNGSYSADAKLGDGRLYNVVKIQAYDPDRDIAIFQLGRKIAGEIEEPKGLPFLTLAPGDVQVGDRIATIGSPEGLTNSVSDGIVSAVRSDGGQRFFQISAPISPGSSGGPVLNLDGQVVAISTFQLVEGQNLNFAIPAHEIATVEASQVDVSLQQLYWQQHLSTARKSQRQSPENTQQTATRQESAQLLTGTFLGTVHNLTADLQANFGIFIEEEQDTILGCMAVRKPLYGSGPLLGSINGALIQFDVTSTSNQIHFEGVRSGNRISGTYRVPSPDGSYQSGEFVLDRADSKALPRDFDPQKDCPTDSDINR